MPCQPPLTLPPLGDGVPCQPPDDAVARPSGRGVPRNPSVFGPLLMVDAGCGVPSM